MSWQSRASAARQQPHSVVEAISEPLNSIKRRRGLLQTRSQAKFRPILTDFSDDRGVRIGKLEFVHCRRRALHEQSAGKLRASAAESCLAVRGLSQGEQLSSTRSIYPSVVTTTESEVTEIIET